MKKRAKRFTKDSPVPNQPKQVMDYAFETSWEIAARTGLDLHRLCEALKRWTDQGFIVHRHLYAGGVMVPVFRLRATCDKL